jgi:hypothetical protein
MMKNMAWKAPVAGLMLAASLTAACGTLGGAAAAAIYDITKRR